MLFHYYYFKKHCHVGKNIFFNLAAECSLILDYSIHNIFHDINNVNLISNVIGERAPSLSFAMGWLISNVIGKRAASLSFALIGMF